MFTIGNWRPAIGDPSVMGWFTVFSYYFTAVICVFWAFFRKGKEYKLWLFLGLFIGFLGFCKQYNLLSALTEIGRIVVRRSGLIKQRRIIQIIFLLLLTPFTVIAVVNFIKKTKQLKNLPLKIALFFTIYLSIFVLLRAVSLHQWEEILGIFLWGFIKINWLGELIGIYGVFLAGIVNLIYKDNSYLSQKDW